MNFIITYTLSTSGIGATLCFPSSKKRISTYSFLKRLLMTAFCPAKTPTIRIFGILAGFEVLVGLGASGWLCAGVFARSGAGFGWFVGG